MKNLDFSSISMSLKAIYVVAVNHESYLLEIYEKVIQSARN